MTYEDIQQFEYELIEDLEGFIQRHIDSDFERRMTDLAREMDADLAGQLAERSEDDHLDTLYEDRTDYDHMGYTDID